MAAKLTLENLPDNPDFNGFAIFEAIVLRLEWAFGQNAEVVGLFLCELGQLHTDAIQVQGGDFFVQFLVQTIRADLVGGAVGPEVQLREALAAVLSTRASDGRWRNRGSQEAFGRNVKAVAGHTADK
jgi:hypothetical protein